MARLFDILGPTMVGPSSSHTAGACRLGFVVQSVAGGLPDRARICLHGSFAMTGEGHGTKPAMLGGLLGLLPDNPRIREAERLATEAGLEWEFYTCDLGEDAHPNSARFEVWREAEELEVVGSSIGGGRIRIEEIDGFAVDLSGSFPTMVVLADDIPGTVARITSLLASKDVNLATMRVDRTGRGGRAMMTIETDSDTPFAVVEELRNESWVHWIRNVHQLNA
jgi:L-serine dehydratase